MSATRGLVLQVLVLFSVGGNLCAADSEKVDEDEKLRQPFATIYNDKEARRLWKVASSVYLVNGSSALFADCIYNKLGFASEYTQSMTYACTAYTFKECANLIAIDHNAKEIHISAGGHGDLSEFLRDRLRPPRRLGDLLVHETAFLQYDLFWNYVGVSKFWERRHRLYPSYRLVLTGHQTGGFVAQLVVTSGQLPASQVVVRTFGSPKMFLSGLPHVSNNSNIYIKTVPNSFHITRAGDDVPRQSVKGAPGWDGPVKEIYYGQGMQKGATHTICKSFNDPECSSGPANTDTTLEANEVYFEQHWKTACFADDDV